MATHSELICDFFSHVTVVCPASPLCSRITSLNEICGVWYNYGGTMIRSPEPGTMPSVCIQQYVRQGCLLLASLAKGRVICIYSSQLRCNEHRNRTLNMHSGDSIMLCQTLRGQSSCSCVYKRTIPFVADAKRASESYEGLRQLP